MDQSITQGHGAKQAEPTLLSNELKDHYISHGVSGIETFIKRKATNNLQDNNIHNEFRFIRINPRFDEEETIRLLTAELPQHLKPIPVSWLPKQLSFYAIPITYSLVKSNLFKDGRIYGMDVSSGAAVSALLLKDHDRKCNFDDNRKIIMNRSFDNQTSLRVLDLCCAPGLKTCAIVDLLTNSKSFINEHYPKLKNIQVIGVDISEQRMHLCRNIVEKYHVNKTTCGDEINKNVKSRISLYCADGKTFGTNLFDPSTLIFDSIVALEEEAQKGERKRMNKSARARHNRKLRKVVSDEMKSKSNHEGTDKDDVIITVPLFDHVLVDAECSTDGAVRHMMHKLKKHDTACTQNLKLTDTNNLLSLVKLQKDLINSGFRLLKPGGILVYSTCSLSTEQNEDVVSWLLQEYSMDAYLIPVSFADEFKIDDNKDMIFEGSLGGTVRFHPNVVFQTEVDFNSRNAMFGGGFFLAKIGKRVT